MSANRLLRITHARSPSATAVPRRSSALQRKCACGRSPGPTGECTTCRRDRHFGGASWQERQCNSGQSTLAAPEQGGFVSETLVANSGDHTPRSEPTLGGNASESQSIILPYAGQLANDKGRINSIAVKGISEREDQLPYVDRLQQAFGHHDVRGIHAHLGPRATDACREMGAAAFTRGNHVVFGHFPSLHTAAHEAAHVVQQRAGIAISGNVGKPGDAYESHADAVANAVTSGGRAEGILDRFLLGPNAGIATYSGEGAASPVQMEPVSAIAIASLVVGIVGTLIGAGSAAYTVAQAKNDEISGGVEETLDFSGRFFLISDHETYLKAIGEVLVRQKLDDLDPGWETRGESDHLQQAKTAAEIQMAETMTNRTTNQVLGLYAWGGDDSRAGGEARPGGSVSFSARGGAFGTATISVYGSVLNSSDFPGLDAAASRHGFDVSNPVPYLERVILQGEGRTGEGIVEDDQCYVRPGTFSAGRRDGAISVTGQFYFDWDENTTRMVWGDANSIRINSVPEPNYRDGPPDT